MTMPPQETTVLLDDGSPSSPPPPHHPAEHLDVVSGGYEPSSYQLGGSGGRRRPRQLNAAFAKSFATARTAFARERRSRSILFMLASILGLAVTAWVCVPLARAAIARIRRFAIHHPGGSTITKNHTGPYRLVERQVGARLFDYYDFLDGPDSLGSAGFNLYLGERRAKELQLAGVDDDGYVILRSTEGDNSTDFMRQSVRLEGRRRWDRGLFVLDVSWMPWGCGVWPAFWLTDEDDWPDHGEIDVVEGVNEQTVAKTALHTRESCSMYAHVPPYAASGHWDSATGLPNTWTGVPDLNTTVPADNCWVLAPHQWANQGCVAISDEPGTIGQPFNERGGGVYVLEWDPANRYMKSWVFPADQGIPDNLQAAMDAANKAPASTATFDFEVTPDPDEWEKLPYAYFAIGETTGCSTDHFQNHHLIFNLAFCGAVSGNRFLSDCPEAARDFLVTDRQGNPDPVATCNAYIASNPKVLDDAYWKVRGVYVYQRQ